MGLLIKKDKRIDLLAIGLHGLWLRLFISSFLSLFFSKHFFIALCINMLQ